MRDPFVGIRLALGSNNNNTYTKASIEQTLNQESRIASVDSIAIKDSNDSTLKIDVDFTDINGVTQKASV